MSYDINLVDPITRETLQLDEPHQMKGGTYCIGGSTDAHLNITYNYAKHYARVFPTLETPRPLAPEWMHKASPTLLWGGVRAIYGLTGAESIPLLDTAIAMLGDDVDADYWKPTEGNAKRALVQLRALATMRPDGLWSGD